MTYAAPPTTYEAQVPAMMVQPGAEVMMTGPAMQTVAMGPAMQLTQGTGVMGSVEVAGAMQPMATMGSVEAMGMPQPVATNMRPPVPMQTQNAMRGGVTQVKVAGAAVRGEGAATFQQFSPTTVQTKEVGRAVYITGPTNEVDAGPQIMQVRQEQVVMGEVQQQIVEIPTIQVIEQFQDVPEVQVIEKHVEVEQVVQETVEQQVHVPKIMPQKRVQHRSVEQIIHIPVPVMK